MLKPRMRILEGGILDISIFLFESSAIPNRRAVTLDHATLG